jgi:putative ABC transport system permease protein
MFQKVIDVMLLVLVGLLGVAVLIALVGVANTLSLSVIERRRESATLRAVGMSRRQLRASLAIEGMLIAGIGALVGVLLGTLYAWLGSKLLLGAFTTVVFTVRWADIAAIFAVALAAGLIASIVPGRSAARTSPVAALAVE